MTAPPARAHTDTPSYHLADYAPGRIASVPESAWPELLRGEPAPDGVVTTIPRYALDLLAPDRELDLERLRGLLIDPVRTQLDELSVPVARHAERLWVVADAEVLAAQLALGADRVRVRLTTLTAR